MCDRSETQTDGVARGHSRKAHLVEVGGRAQSELLSLVEQSLHDFRILRAEFDSIDAFVRGPADPFPGEFRGLRLEWSGSPTVAGERPLIDVQPRSDDLVLRAPLALVE